MSRTHWIKGVVVKESKDAILFDYEGEEVWIPRSQIEDYADAELRLGEPTEIEVTDWIAREKGLVE